MKLNGFRLDLLLGFWIELMVSNCPIGEPTNSLLKLEKNEEVSTEAFLDACHLAAFYSDRKTDSHVEILYTKAKIYNFWQFFTHFMPL